MRLLEELYFGNIELNGYTPKDTQSKKVLARIVNTEESLMAKLEGKEKTLLIDLTSAQGELNGITAVENFIAGFSIGAALLAEVSAISGDMVLE